MQIKTITCHDVYNVGASLQAYALVTHLSSLGHEVEIIDYKPDYLSGHHKLFTVNNNKYARNFLLRCAYIIAKMPKRLMNLSRKAVFDKFKKEYLPLTEMKYQSNVDLAYEPPVADVYIAGSDQIWNPLFKNGHDPAFFLNFVPFGRKKVSYAASFGTSDLNEKFKHKLCKNLSDFNAISVREMSGMKHLKSIGFENVTNVLDPVFLVDCDGWKQVSANVSNGERYIFVYDFDRSSLVEELVKVIARQKGLKIYTYFKTKYADKNLKNVGPREFLSYIMNAEHIMSNSFHATAFSIIFGKNFHVVPRDEGINSRMVDLLNVLKISDRMVTSKEELCQSDSSINYQMTNDKLAILIKESKNFIQSAIDF